MSRYFSLAVEVPKDSVELAVAALFDAGISGVEERQGPTKTTLLLYAESDEQRVRFEQALTELAKTYAPTSLPLHIKEHHTNWETAWLDGLDSFDLTAKVRIELVGEDSARIGEEPGTIRLGRALAFGYGEHPTTRLCAERLETIYAARKPSLLDVGSGTGVLGILAAKLGAEAVCGVEISERALSAARHNAAHNGCEARSTFVHPDHHDWQRRFDLVVANIEANVLCEFAERIASSVAPSGVLLLSGLLSEQKASVAQCYASFGLSLGFEAESEDWWLLELTRATSGF
jgi:ribosomal protein L11 methyltransferase